MTAHAEIDMDHGTGGGGGGSDVPPTPTSVTARPLVLMSEEEKDAATLMTTKQLAETTTTAANNYQYQQPPPPQRIRSGTGQQPQQYSNNNGMLQPQQLVVVANGKPRRTEGGRKSSSGGGGGSGGLKVLCCCFGLKPKTKRGATTIAQPQNQGLASQTTVVQTATQQQQPQPIYIQHQEYRQQQQQNGNGNNYGHPQQQQQLARYAPQHLAPESLITQVTKDDPTTTTTPTSNGGGRLAEALAVSLNGFSINNGASAQQQQQISPLPAPSPYSPKPGDPVLLGPPRSLDSNLKCLVIDLDETLVHSSFKPVKAADFVLPVEIDGVVHQVYVLKRPHVDAFLDHVSRRFECVLFTASLAKYADPVADLLDGGRGVFRARLFREACVMHRGNYVKDLSRLGRPLERVAIIDNSPVSYVFHPANALPVQTWFDDPSDRELLALMPTLDQLHRAQTVYDVLAPQATQQQPMRIASPPPPPLHQNGHGAGNNPLTALLSPAPPPASKMVMVGKAN